MDVVFLPDWEQPDALLLCWRFAQIDQGCYDMMTRVAPDRVGLFTTLPDREFAVDFLDQIYRFNNGFVDIFNGKKLGLHFTTYPRLNLALYARTNGEDRATIVCDVSRAPLAAGGARPDDGAVHGAQW
jgi:hypothetical protein